MWITANWKILKEMVVPEHLTCLKKQQLEPDTEQLTMSKLGKEIKQGCILSPCLFHFYAEYIMWNAGQGELQAGLNIARKNNSLRYAMATL